MAPKTVKMIKFKPRSVLSERYAKYYDKQSKSDIIFIVGEHKIEIFGHSFIIAAASQVFDANFSGEWRDKNTVILQDEDEETFRTILTFIYKGSFDFDSKNLFDVLRLLHRYMIQDGIDILTSGKVFQKNFMKCVWQYLSYGKLVDDTDLMNQCLDFIDKNAKFAFHLQDLMAVDASTIDHVIRRNSLVIKEVDLFRKLLNWSITDCQRKSLEVTPANQRAVMESFIHRIRFPLMSVKEFYTVNLVGILNKNELQIIYTKGILSSSKKGTGFDFKPRSGHRQKSRDCDDYKALIIEIFAKCFNVWGNRFAGYICCRACLSLLDLCF